MNRPHESKRHLLALFLALVALVAVAPTASAAPPAQDEYTYDVPGYGDDAGGRTVLGSPDAAKTAPQLGVAGELEDAASPLSSILSAVPVLIALALALASLATIQVVRASHRPR